MGMRSVWLGRRWFTALLWTMALLIVLAALLAWIGTVAHKAAQLKAEDLLLLTPDSVTKVAAAAQAGDLSAQGTLGAAYLLGSAQVPKNVTRALYWFHQVVSREEQEYKWIRARMGIILEQRRRTTDGAEIQRLELEYLDLVIQKLSYEQAFTGLVQIYSGRYGTAYENSELAIKHLRQGAEAGYPWAQRLLGVATMFGLRGVSKDPSEGIRLIKEAARQGDHEAEYLLGKLYESGVMVRANPDAARYWFARAAPDVPEAAQRLRELDCRSTT